MKLRNIRIPAALKISSVFDLSHTLSKNDALRCPATPLKTSQARIERHCQTQRAANDNTKEAQAKCSTSVMG